VKQIQTVRSCKGRHRDAVRSSQSYTAFRYGHKWIVLALLVRLSFACRPWALPLLVVSTAAPAKTRRNAVAMIVNQAAVDQAIEVFFVALVPSPFVKQPGDGHYFRLIGNPNRRIRRLGRTPAIPDPACRPDETCLKIPDRDLKTWRDSNPKGFSTWFDKQAARRRLMEKGAKRLSASANVEPLRDPAPARASLGPWKLEGLQSAPGVPLELRPGQRATSLGTATTTSSN
jgi:hypothetical protein